MVTTLNGRLSSCLCFYVSLEFLKQKFLNRLMFGSFVFPGLTNSPSQGQHLQSIYRTSIFIRDHLYPYGACVSTALCQQDPWCCSWHSQHHSFLLASYRMLPKTNSMASSLLNWHTCQVNVRARLAMH